MLPHSSVEFVALAPEPGVPGWLSAELHDPGVPRECFQGLFRAVDKAVLGPGTRTDMVVIGVIGDPAFYCVDLKTTAVVLVDEAGTRTPVNATLRQFRDCVQAVDALWRPADWIEVEDDHRAADRLREVVSAIDGTAFGHDEEGVWDTFYYDVQMGNYST